MIYIDLKIYILNENELVIEYLDKINFLIQLKLQNLE